MLVFWSLHQLEGALTSDFRLRFSSWSFDSYPIYASNTYNDNFHQERPIYNLLPYLPYKQSNFFLQARET
jgi:hypothetical protein